MVDNCVFTWLEHQESLTSIVQSLYDSESLFDCTLLAGGQHFSVHRLILSSCSPFFCRILKDHPSDNPVLSLDGVSVSELRALIEYMYTGETSVLSEDLNNFFQTTKILEIEGLSHYTNEDVEAILSAENSNTALADEETNALSYDSCEESPNIFSYLEESMLGSQSLVLKEDDMEYMDEENTSDNKLILKNVVLDKRYFDYNSVYEDENDESTMESSVNDIHNTDEEGEEYLNEDEEDEEEEEDEEINIRRAAEHRAIENDHSEYMKRPRIIKQIKNIPTNKQTYIKHINRLPITTKKFLIQRPKIEDFAGKGAVQTGHDKKIYICLKCGNKYSHRRTLLHHIHWICDQPATYSCNLCPYMGKRKFQLKSHMKHAHLMGLT